MKRALGLLSILLLALTLLPGGGSTLAQDASPAAGECVAPALPPGTPSSEEDLAAYEEAEAAEDAAQEAAGTLTATPADEGTSADPATAEAATAAMENVVACLNGGDYLAAGALTTQFFLQNFIEVPTVYDFPAMMEGAGPLEVLRIENALVYADGTVSVDFVYTGFFNGPTAITSERWYLVQTDGIYKVNWISPNSLPADVLPGATVVEVVMVDYAFYVEPKKVPAGQPVIFRVTNQAASTTGHVAVLLSYPAGTTAEQLIAGDVSVMDASTGFYGALYLEPGQRGDLAFTTLEAGTYFFGCDVETEGGHVHFELGMVAQITVE
jgi:uncharacterized cupredoxin-like copper-binding protein